MNWQNVGFDNIILSVQNGQLDMGVSGFSITPERLVQVSFTVPHSTTEGQVVMLQSVMAAKHITTLNSLADFKTLGIKVGVQSGNVEQEELQNAGVDIATWSDSASPFQDLVSSNPSVQAVYAETPITTSWIAQFAAQGHPTRRCIPAPILSSSIPHCQRLTHSSGQNGRRSSTTYLRWNSGPIESKMACITIRD